MTTSALLSLEARVKAQAFGLGFDLVGICTLGPVETARAFDEWLEEGYAGTMDYLPRGREKRRDSRLPVPGAISDATTPCDCARHRTPSSTSRQVARTAMFAAPRHRSAETTSIGNAGRSSA